MRRSSILLAAVIALFAAAPRTFRFRARLPREAAYPYATGNSRIVRVRVG